MPSLSASTSWQLHPRSSQERGTVKVPSTYSEFESRFRGHVTMALLGQQEYKVIQVHFWITVLTWKNFRPAREH